MRMRLACAAALLLMIADRSWAQEPYKRPPLPPAPGPEEFPIDPAPVNSGFDPGLAVGEPAPDFRLDGSRGRTVRLADLEGRWTLMVFAPDCADLAPLEGLDGALRGMGVRVCGVSQDGAAAAARYARRARISFLVLSDPTVEVSQVYGMFDPAEDAIQPGLVLLDPQGIVRATRPGHLPDGRRILQLVERSTIGV